MKAFIPRVLPVKVAITTLAAIMLLNVLRLSTLLTFKTQAFTHLDFPLAPNSNLPRELPINVRNAAMIFNDTSHYGLYDVREWEALTPPGNGWVLLEPDSKPYAVSMFHQLHCLNSMRYDLTQSKIGKYPTEENLAHAHHCYNYHRQNLLCGLDLTLSSTGYGLGDTAHVCRDWAQIREYLEENYKKFYMYFPY